MSDSPPPVDEKNDVEIDLSSDLPTNKISVEENDLFFSTISDPVEKVLIIYLIHFKLIIKF